MDRELRAPGSSGDAQADPIIHHDHYAITHEVDSSASHAEALEI